MPLTKTTTTITGYNAKGSGLSAHVRDNGHRFTLTLFGHNDGIADVFDALDDLELEAHTPGMARFPPFPSEVLDDVEHLIEYWVEHGDPTIATALNNRAAADKRKANANG